MKTPCGCPSSTISISTLQSTTCMVCAKPCYERNTFLQRADEGHNNLLECNDTLHYKWNLHLSRVALIFLSFTAPKRAAVRSIERLSLVESDAWISSYKAYDFTKLGIYFSNRQIPSSCSTEQWIFSIITQALAVEGAPAKESRASCPHFETCSPIPSQHWRFTSALHSCLCRTWVLIIMYTASSVILATFLVIIAKTGSSLESSYCS